MAIAKAEFTIEEVARWAKVPLEMLTIPPRDLQELNAARKRMDEFQIQLNRVLGTWEKTLRDALGS